MICKRTQESLPSLAGSAAKRTSSRIDSAIRERCVSRRNTTIWNPQELERSGNSLLAEICKTSGSCLKQPSAIHIDDASRRHTPVKSIRTHSTVDSGSNALKLLMIMNPSSFSPRLAFNRRPRSIEGSKSSNCSSESPHTEHNDAKMRPAPLSPFEGTE